MDESLEVTKIYSVAGMLPADTRADPTAAVPHPPHHDLARGLVGGGSRGLGEDNAEPSWGSFG